MGIYDLGFRVWDLGVGGQSLGSETLNPEVLSFTASWTVAVADAVVVAVLRRDALMVCRAYGRVL